MTRRLLLATPFTHRLFADDPAIEVYELAGRAAAFLSEDDASGFLGCFDPEMEGYETFAASVAGLLRECEVQSSIEVLRNEGDAVQRLLELDWLMQVKLRSGAGRVERRREAVQCRARKFGKRWKFVSFSPQAFLAPMKLR